MMHFKGALDKCNIIPPIFFQKIEILLQKEALA